MAAVVCATILISVLFLKAEWIVGIPVLNVLCLTCLVCALIFIIFLIKEQFFPGQIQTVSFLCRKYLSIASVFYYVTLGAALVRFTLTTTMFPAIMSDSLTDFINTFSLVLLNMSILAFAVSLSSVQNRLQIVFELSILAIFYIWHSQMPDCALIQYLVILVLGATGKNFRTILKIYLGVKVSIFAAAFYASQNGYIYNKMGMKLGTMSHSLGTINTTDCAAYILFMLIAYCILRQPYRRRNWQSFADYPILLFIAEYSSHLTAARADSVWMYLAIALSFLCHIGSLVKWPEKSKKIFRVICYVLTPIYTVLLLILYLAVTGCGRGKGPESALTDWITDESLLQRFQIPQRAIREYGITLFGNFDTYPDRGFGGHLTSYNFDYSYIDMSYMRMLVIYGIFVTIILMTIFLFTNIRMVWQHRYFLFSMMVLIAFSGVIEQHLAEFYYDAVLLAAFARYGKAVRGKEKVPVRNDLIGIRNRRLI